MSDSLVGTKPSQSSEEFLNAFMYVNVLCNKIPKCVCVCVASRQADLQPGEVLLLLEEDAQPDVCDGPAGPPACPQEGEGGQVQTDTGSLRKDISG